MRKGLPTWGRARVPSFSVGQKPSVTPALNLGPIIPSPRPLHLAFKVAYQFSYPNRLKVDAGGGVQEFRELEEEGGTCLRLRFRRPEEGEPEDTTEWKTYFITDISSLLASVLL